MSYFRRKGDSVALTGPLGKDAGHNHGDGTNIGQESRNLRVQKIGIRKGFPGVCHENLSSHEAILEGNSCHPGFMASGPGQGRMEDAPKEETKGQQGG